MEVFVKKSFLELRLTSAVVTSLFFALMDGALARNLSLFEPSVAVDLPTVTSVTPFIPIGSEFGSDFQVDDIGKVEHIVDQESKGASAMTEMPPADIEAIEKTAQHFTGSEDELMDLAVEGHAKAAANLTSDAEGEVVKVPTTPSSIASFGIKETLEMAKYAELSYYQPHFEAPGAQETNFAGGMKNKEDNDAFEERIKQLVAEGHTVRFFGTATENAGLIIERTDGRVIVSYHGTDTTKNLLTDGNVLYAIDKRTGGRFHSGFYQDFAETAAQVETHLRQIAKSRGISFQDLGKTITFTGHSLGASLATVAGYWFTKVYDLEGTRVAGFATARAMDYTTALDYDELMGDRTLTVSKYGDPVPYAHNATIFGSKHVGQRIHLPKNVEAVPGSIKHHSMKTYTAAFAEMAKEAQKAFNSFQVYDAGWYFNPFSKARLLIDYYLVNPTHKSWHWLRGWEADGLKAKKQDKKGTIKAEKLGDKIAKQSFLKLSTPELERMIDSMTIRPFGEDGLVTDLDQVLEDAFDASMDVKGGIKSLKKKMKAEKKAAKKANKAGGSQSRWGKMKSSVKKKFSRKKKETTVEAVGRG